MYAPPPSTFYTHHMSCMPICCKLHSNCLLSKFPMLGAIETAEPDRKFMQTRIDRFYPHSLFNKDILVPYLKQRVCTEEEREKRSETWNIYSYPLVNQSYLQHNYLLHLSISQQERQSAQRQTFILSQGLEVGIQEAAAIELTKLPGICKLRKRSPAKGWLISRRTTRRKWTQY